MGCCFSKKPAVQEGSDKPPPPPPSIEDCISHFQTINTVDGVDCLIDIIDKLLETLPNKSNEDKVFSDLLNDRSKSVWKSFLDSGSRFLEFVNKHIRVEQVDDETREAVAQILRQVGDVHWVVGGLSVVAFLLEQNGQISKNRKECIELLKQMAKLAGHIRKLKNDMPQENKILSDAIIMIVEGSILCASQLKSGTLFRFLKASVDSRKLNDLQSKINRLHNDLILRVLIQLKQEQPAFYPSMKPLYPDYAVGIEDQKNQVLKLLDMKKGKNSPLAVVIYGFGGIGKTTLATAVIAGLDLTDYNFSRVQIEEERSRNDIKSMQQQILKDAFPAYTNGRNVTLRNSAEGQDHLTKAFQAQGNKPVFLFVDNALRAEDLRELFPKRLADLPDRSRIVLTARNLAVADMLKDAGLERREHRVDLLPRQEAIKILFRDSNPNKQLDEEEEKILQTCAGVPLVLEIVGAQLHKQNYIVDNCRQIVDALEKGKDIKTENLSQRLVHSVYTELEASTQEAFLDICCFFASWSRRNVDYIVGTDEVKTLEEAALLKSENDKVIVHDIIRAKGLSMSESNRIMNMDSWIQFVGGSKALDQIKGIRLAMEGPESESGYELDVEHIISMEKSLRVLDLGRQINLSRSSQKTPKFKEVRFLRLEGDVSGLWSLTLESRERPDHLAALKVLLLEEWDKMQNLSEQVSGLRHLCKLSVCGGVSLRNLPHSFGQLSSMQELILTRCGQLEELPSSFGELRSLKHLSLAECVNLKELPSSFGKLSSLEVLNLESCWKLEVLPSSFGQLRRLKKLTLQSFIKELPSNFGELGALEELQLCGCMELKELPVSIGQLINLTHLDLGYCMNLKTLPYSIGKLRSLRDFNLMACSKLESLPSNIWDLSFLTQIDLRRCKGLKDFSPPTQKNPGLVIWLPTN